MIQLSSIKWRLNKRREFPSYMGYRIGEIFCFPDIWNNDTTKTLINRTFLMVNQIRGVWCCGFFFFPNMLPKCVFLKSFICIMILFPTQICRFTSEILRVLYSAENIVKIILTIWHIYHMLLAENIRKEKWKNIPVVLIDCGFLLTNCSINPTRFHVDESHWVHPQKGMHF